MKAVAIVVDLWLQLASGPSWARGRDGTQTSDKTGLCAAI